MAEGRYVVYCSCEDYYGGIQGTGSYDDLEEAKESIKKAKEEVWGVYDFTIIDRKTGKVVYREW